MVWKANANKPLEIRRQKTTYLTTCCEQQTESRKQKVKVVKFQVFLTGSSQCSTNNWSSRCHQPYLFLPLHHHTSRLATILAHIYNFNLACELNTTTTDVLHAAVFAKVDQIDPSSGWICHSRKKLKWEAEVWHKQKEKRGQNDIMCFTTVFVFKLKN